MNMTETFVLWELRCGICGGVGTIESGEDPTGDRIMCPHHGTDGETDREFTETGIGRIGAEFTIRNAEVVEAWEGFYPDQSVRIREQEACEPLGGTRADDFKAVVIDGQSYSERAAERGVAHGTVWKNVRDIRIKLEE